MLVFWYETIVNCKANINNWFTNFARNSSEPSIATASRKMQNFKYWFELCHQITVQCALCMPINISNESFNRACHRMGKFKFKLKLSERFSLCHLLWNEAYHYSMLIYRKKILIPWSKLFGMTIYVANYIIFELLMISVFFFS